MHPAPKPGAMQDPEELSPPPRSPSAKCCSFALWLLPKYKELAALKVKSGSDGPTQGVHRAVALWAPAASPCCQCLPNPGGSSPGTRTLLDGHPLSGEGQSCRADTAPEVKNWGCQLRLVPFPERTQGPTPARASDADGHAISATP